MLLRLRETAMMTRPASSAKAAPPSSSVELAPVLARSSELLPAEGVAEGVVEGELAAGDGVPCVVAALVVPSVAGLVSEG